MNDNQIIEAMCRRLNELFEDDLHEWVRVMKEYQLIVANLRYMTGRSITRKIERRRR